MRREKEEPAVCWTTGDEEIIATTSIEREIKNVNAGCGSDLLEQSASYIRRVADAALPYGLDGGMGGTWVGGGAS